MPNNAVAAPPIKTHLARFTSPGDAQVAVLTIESGQLNLFDEILFSALAADLRSLTADPPRALIVRANGQAVSAGVDVCVFEGLTPSAAAALSLQLFAEICHPLEALPCPVVFAAHGLTLTVAFELALACAHVPRHEPGAVTIDFHP